MKAGFSQKSCADKKLQQNADFEVLHFAIGTPLQR
jgi:hypothetical protein